MFATFSNVFTNSDCFNRAIEEYKLNPEDTESLYGRIQDWDVMSLSWDDIHKHMSTCPTYKYIHADDDDVKELVEMWIHLQTESDSEFKQHNREPSDSNFQKTRQMYDLKLNTDHTRWEVLRRQSLHHSVCGKRDILKTSRTGWFTATEIVFLLNSNTFQAARKLTDVYWR